MPLRTALCAAAAAAAAVAFVLPSGSHAICFRTYTTEDCTGPVKDSGCGADEACDVADDPSRDFTGSSRTDCASLTSAGSWTLQVWNASDCADGGGTIAIDIAGEGLACEPLGNGDSVVVDCGGTASCFSGDATARLEGGGRKRVRDLVPGDSVLATSDDGALEYARVFRVPHHDDEADTAFLRIRTAGGRSLEVSPGHMLHAGECCSLDALKYAADVRKGDLLFTAAAAAAGGGGGGSGGERVEPDEVVSVETVHKRGAYNAHTLTGQIVVDGVAASHFTDGSTWAWRRSLAPAWYRIVDAASALVRF